MRALRRGRRGDEGLHRRWQRQSAAQRACAPPHSGQQHQLTFGPTGLFQMPRSLSPSPAALVAIAAPCYYPTTAAMGLGGTIRDCRHEDGRESVAPPAPALRHMLGCRYSRTECAAAGTVPCCT